MWRSRLLCGMLSSHVFRSTQLNFPRLAASIVLPILVVAGLSACQRADEPAAPAASAAVVPPASPKPAPVPEMPKAPMPAIESLLKPDDTLASAQARLGAANVVARELDGAEGETFHGWVVYPDDPKRSIEVVLDEDGVHPEAIRVSSEEATAWMRSDGVRIGMSSVELQTLNGKPFDFSGFDWDYGGSVLDWHGGKLDPGNAPRGGVSLCPPEKVSEDYPTGDATFSSSDPKMLANPAHVCEFVVVVAAG